MLEVYDRSLKKVAILENAYNITETKEINSVYTFEFSLPENDDKNVFCNPLWYVRYNDGELYRIISPHAEINDTGTATYECEHVIATLIDDVLFGSHVVGNIGVYTDESINYVLGKQTEARWVLDACDFARQFEYGWENENLLAALFSIPNRFVDPYMWTYNTHVYPWKVSLQKIDTSATPQFYVRATKNLLSRSTSRPFGEVCTRLYCLGYGEGVNQLTIADVNNGVPYLQSPQSIIDKYGIVSRIWVDRRFEDAQSLKEQGQAYLDGLQEPQRSIEVSVADLYEMTGADYDKAELGRITRLVEDDVDTYIIGITKNYDTPGNIKLTLANKATDIASTIADLADRQRIEQVYSQGATQLYGQSVQANATPSIGAVLNFWIPDDMRIVNAVKAKISLDAFRSYSKATGGGGATSTTSGGGGGSQTTSGSGGGSNQTSSSGGGGTRTSNSGGRRSITTGADNFTTEGPQYNYTDYSERIVYNTGGMVSTTYTTYENGDGSHRHRMLDHAHTNADTVAHRHSMGNHKHHMVHKHTFELPSHTHDIDLPNHTHDVRIPSHAHTVSIPSHTHSISLPDHTHDIQQGIFEFGSPSSATIYINGAARGTMGGESEVDITSWLVNDDGKISRGTWHKVEVVPNDLAYVTIDLYIQGFVQSRGGGTY